MAVITAWMASQAIHADDMNLIITLDRADLQRRIDRMFPLVRKNELVTVRMHHPQVILTEHSGRIGLRVRLDATAAEGFSISGLAGIDGVLRFAGDTGNFYLNDARIEELQIDGVPALYADQIRRLADGIVSELLQERPVYTLGQMGESKRIMGGEIRSIEVHDGKLVVELAMP